MIVKVTWCWLTEHILPRKEALIWGQNYGKVCKTPTFPWPHWNFQVCFIFKLFGLKGGMVSVVKNSSFPALMPKCLQNVQFITPTGYEHCTCNVVCCLQRACSRALSCWLKDSWSDWMADAAEASTCCLSCSPSSWRTKRESFTVPSPLRRS